MNFDRAASTSIKAPANCAAARKPDADKNVWRGMFDAAREALGVNVQGVTCVKNGRAWFQIVGDVTPYSVNLTAAELRMFFAN